MCNRVLVYVHASCQCVCVSLNFGKNARKMYYFYHRKTNYCAQ